MVKPYTYAEYKKLSPAKKAAADRKHAASSGKSGKKAYSKKTKPAYVHKKAKASSSKASASCKKEIKKELSHTAMGPSIDSKAAICTDTFRLGEYADGIGGLKQITDPDTGYNGIAEICLVNPEKLVALARKKAVKRGEIGLVYKLEGYTPNYYRYAFNSLEIEITNTVPEQCSGDLMAFFVPDVNAVVTPQNVLDVFESIRGVNGKDSHNAIIIPPGKTKSLHLGKTALLFTKYNSAIAGEDKRMSVASLLVIASMSPFLSASSIVGNGVDSQGAPVFVPNSPETRRWNSEVAIVKIKTSCHFFEKQYVPKTPGIASPLEEGPSEIVPSEGHIPPNIMDETYAPPPIVNQQGTNTQFLITPQSLAQDLPTTPPADPLAPPVKTSAISFHKAALNSALIQSQYGEVVAQLDCLGRKVSKSRDSRPVWSNKNNALFASNSFFEWSWEGAFDFVTTYVGGFVKTQLTNIFGTAAGEGLYDIGKDIMYFCLDAVGFPNPAKGINKPGTPGSNYTWNAQGLPQIGAKFCAGLLEPYSAYWFSARDYFKVANPTLYSHMMELEDIGETLSFIASPAEAMHDGPSVLPTALNGPVIGATGEDELFYTDKGGILVLEEGFGEPEDVNDSGQLVQLASLPGSTKGIDADWLRGLPVNQYKQVTTRPGQAIQFYIWHETAPAMAVGPILMFAFAQWNVAGAYWQFQQYNIAQMIELFKNNSVRSSSSYVVSGNTNFSLAGHIGQLDTGLTGPTVTATTLYDGTFPLIAYNTNVTGLEAFPVDRWPCRLDLSLTFSGAQTSSDAGLSLVNPTSVYYDTGSGDVQRVSLPISNLFATPQSWYVFCGMVV